MADENKIELTEEEINEVVSSIQNAPVDGYGSISKNKAIYTVPFKKLADKLKAKSKEAFKKEKEENARTYIAGKEKGEPNGVATLDENAKIPTAQIPDLEKVSKTGDEMTGPLRVSSARSLEKAQLQNNGVEVGVLDAEEPVKTWYANGFILRTKDGKDVYTALPDKDGTLALEGDGIGEISLILDPNTYVLTLEAKTRNGKEIVNKSIDLPLESVVVSGSFNDSTKNIELTLQSGSVISFPVGDLVHGLLSSTEKGVANGVASLNAEGKVPNNQLPPLDYVKKTGDTMTGNLVIMSGAEPVSSGLYNDRVTFAGPSGVCAYKNGVIERAMVGGAFTKIELPAESGIIALVKDLAPLKTKTELLEQVVDESGLMYTQDIEDAYTERVTADGLNVLDGSKAILEKVVGSTVACQNLFNFDKIKGDNEIDNDLIIDFEQKSAVIPASSNMCSIGASFIENAFEQFNKVVNITDAGYYCLKVKVTDANGNPLQNVRPRANWIFNFNAENASVDGVSQLVGEYLFTKYLFSQEKLEAIKTANVFRLYMYNFADTTTNQNVVDAYISEFTFCKGDYTIDTMPKYQPYFTGLKSASFGGIESKNADGTETSMLAFPLTETPLGVTIDFKNKKIKNYGYTITLTGQEPFQYYKYGANRNSISFGNLGDYPTQSGTAIGTQYVSTDSKRGKDYTNINQIIFFAVFSWLDILDVLGFTTAGVEPTAEEKTQAVANFKAWVTQRYESGNPVIIRYLTSELQGETDFTAGNEYTVWKGGMEKVLGNDNAEYGAENTLSQNYILVTGVK